MTTVLAVMSVLIGACSTLALSALLLSGAGVGGVALGRRLVAVSAGASAACVGGAIWAWAGGYPWLACLVGAVPLVVNSALLGVLVKLEW